uniref:Putative cytidylyltransferase n=1 Tax=viral metagenome TaxID=1070528 RepID=A0A6H1ZUP9_9ZZZZ
MTTLSPEVYERLRNLPTFRANPEKLLTLTQEQINSETRGSPLCFIPARKHSKRLPNKNKLLLAGKPLVQHAIDVAKESGVFGEIVVSSDDEEILEIAYESKVSPHLRPKRLADDRTQVRHLINFLLGVYPMTDIFCVMIPCNPFRTVGDLRNAYKLMFDKKANYVMSVVKAHPPPQWACQIKKGWLQFYGDYANLIQSQRLEPLYYHNGAFVFARTETFLKEIDKDFHGSKCYPYIMEGGVDINYPEDYICAKVLWKVNKEE